MSQERELAQMLALAVKHATAPLYAKIAVLEARPVVSLDVVEAWKETASDLRARLLMVETRAAVPGPVGPAGPAGERGGVGPVGPQGVIGPAGERGEKGEPGLSVKGDPGERGDKGESGVNGKDGAPGLSIKGDPGERGERGADGGTGARGEKGEPGVQGMRGEKGADGLNGKDGAMGIHGKDGAAGIDGKDGIGVMDAMLDRTGQLIVTLSNGQTKAVGVVVGTDGQDGRDGQPGRDVDPLFVQEFLTKELAKWPRPQDGKDGAPGLSPDDFDWDFNPETRELSITLTRDGKVVAERTKILRGMRIYRKVYESGKTYEEGDVVTWDGSEWTALTHTKERPGTNSDWKLTVKHGEKGARGPEGAAGRDGKDLTQMNERGQKW